MTYDFYNMGQYSTEFIWKMVHAYPIISNVDDPYSASWDEVKDGFINIIDCGNLRPVVESYLRDKSVQAKS